MIYMRDRRERSRLVSTRFLHDSPADVTVGNKNRERVIRTAAIVRIVRV